MARGLGRIFGFHFPVNFYQPYSSRSIKEFWRRWPRIFFPLISLRPIVRICSWDIILITGLYLSLLPVLFFRWSAGTISKDNGTLFEKIYQGINERNIEIIVQAIQQTSQRVYYPLDLVCSFPNDRIFNRRSFHWHEGGAQPVQHALFKEKNPFAHLNLNAAPIETPHAVQSDPFFDIARILGLGGMPYTFTQFKTSVSAEPVYDTDYQKLEAFMSNKDYLKVTASSNKNGLKALLITDSFGLAARHYLEIHFEKTAFISTNGFRPRPGIVKKKADSIHPDVIIFLINENLANIPQALLNLFSLDSD